MTIRSAVVLVVVAVCFGSLALAQPADPPLVNWSAPSSWTPPTARAGGQATTTGKTGSVSATGGTAPMPFVAVSPCRLYDNRASDPPFTGDSTFNTDGQTEWINFYATTTTPYAANGNPNGCTLPTANTVGAWSLKFTYRTSSASQGYLTAYPGNLTTRPGIGTILGSSDRFTSGAAIVAAGSGGYSAIYVYAQYAANTIVIDYNGYFATTPDSGQGLTLYTNTSGYAIDAQNLDTTCGGICGIYGYSASTEAHASAVGGIIGSTALDSAGTYGMDNTGVVTTVINFLSAGVRGEGQNGVIGITSTTGGYGVGGRSEDSSGNMQGEGTLGYGTYGVTGWSYGTANDTAAVFGQMWGTYYGYGWGSYVLHAGVRGESADLGVAGLSNLRGTEGAAYTTSGGNAGWGVLGFNSGTTTYGVYGSAGSSGTTNWAGWFFGNLGASGTKPFVEPHPTEAGTVIRYVALEGPEAGTYFRGKGQFVRHTAVIDVPESFRLVTDPEGLSIQVTPIGDFTSVAVVSIGLNEIVLKSTSDVAFFYTVNGVRHTFKDWQVMVQSGEFTPESADAKIPEALSAEQQRYLIQNGTYNADGSVNMETANRLGWTKVWAEREAQRKAAALASQPMGGQGH